MAINILASAVPLVVLQLVILPLVAVRVDAAEYGLIVTVASFFSFCPATLGNVINNVRLIRNKDYENNGLKGDFNVLVLVSTLLSVLLSMGYIYMFVHLSLTGALLVVVTSALWCLQSYWLVAFRLQVDYVAILVNNILLSIGYTLGLALFAVSGYWELIYFSGQVFSFLYLLKTTRIWREPCVKTRLFYSVLKESGLLTASGLLACMSTYCDRIILFPLLGGSLVSVYYVSTLFAKIISFAASAVNNVALSYLSKVEDSQRKSFWATLFAGAVVCLLCYFAVIVVAPLFLQMLYPQFVQQALIYVPIASATAFVSVLSSLMNPYILRFRPMKWQLVFSAASASIYMIAAFALTCLFGLMGFCWGAFIAETIRFCAIILVFCFAKSR